MKVVYGVVTKGNGEAWITPEKHMSLSIGGGQAGQGYPCVMIVFTKVRRAKSKDDYETWEQKEVANTLNQFDGGDTRATTLIVYEEDKNSCGGRFI